MYAPYKYASPQFHDKWKYEVKCLLNAQSVKSRLQGFEIKEDYNRVYLRFKTSHAASVFGLQIALNAFPLADGNIITALHYGIKFWSGAYSLREYGTVLSNRTIVMLVSYNDYQCFSTSQNSTESKLDVFMKNAAMTARGDGYDPANIIICCTGDEELYGLLAGYVLSDKGYILFPEYDYGTINCFLSMSGVPDLIAVKLGAFQNHLIEQGLMEYGGWLHEIELSASSGIANPSQNNLKPFNEELSIAIEVEDTAPEASGGYGQLRDYTSSRYFDSGMLVCPGRICKLDTKDIAAGAKLGQLENGNFQLLTWTDEGNMEAKFDSTIRLSDDNKKGELIDYCKKMIASNIRKTKTTKDMDLGGY